MAVELRCPKCKAKLRLPVEPEPDSEIECPKCEHVFPCEENIVHAGAAEARPKSKKKKAEEEQPKPAEKKPGEPFKRKKRKSKKRKTSPLVIWGIVAGVAMFLAFAGVIVWFFTKKSSFQEMIMYLPDDCDTVAGINLGHLQKYPLFYNESIKPVIGSTGFKRAGDTLARALGSETIDDVVDYVVQGNGFVGGQPSGARLDATVFKTKEEYDPENLAKIPGAREGVTDGQKWYAIPNIPELGYPGLRVFGPTNRLVVFCSSAVPDAKFRAMLTGNKENADNCSYARAGSLAKQTIRGTVWRFTISSRSSPGFSNGAQPFTGDGDESKAFAADWGPVVQNMKGIGIKASVGSRDLRGEVIVQYGDSDAATAQYRKWREKTWVKDAEEQDPPKWFKTIAQKSGAGKTALNVVRDGLSFRSSGDLFIVRCEVETNLVKQGISGLNNDFTRGSGGGGPPVLGGQGSPRRRRFLARR